MEIGKQLKYISEDNASRLIEKISSLGRQLFALRNALTNPRAKVASPGS